MEKRNVSLLDLEKKIDNYNEKEDILKKMKFNKPDMNINNLNNKFNKDNLLSFLNNFKKENDKMMNEPNKNKYNIEEYDENYEDDEGGEGDDNDESQNKDINLDENKETKTKGENKRKKKNKKNGKEKIELDILMGILEQQKKKEITIDNIIENKKRERENIDKKDLEKGEKEIIDFLLDKNK